MFTATLMKGLILCRSLPKIRKTAKGWHIVWYGLDIDEETMFKYRMLIGDDPNRIKLDMEAGKRISQVLFREKETHYYGYLFSKWIPESLFKKLSPDGEWITHCPMCGKEIFKSVKVWSKDKKLIRIHHVGDDDICKLPLVK